MAMFQRYISIDWSGGGQEDKGVPLAVALADRGQPAKLTPPPNLPLGRRWTRNGCREWLATNLGPDQPRTIVALDFGFGLPWGADRVVFGCTGWRGMIKALTELYTRYETARAVGKIVNAEPRFEGHGPYRFDESRTDFRFYLNHDVAYYRLVETAVPQAISQWYLGAGGTVGFHTITGLAALHDLITLREAGKVQFRVWPQECEHPTDVGDAHVVVESYPALYPTPASFGPCVTPDQRDAWKVLLWMIEADDVGRLAESFSLTPLRFGRVADASFSEQVRFEGWILGVDKSSGLRRA
jgi:hypothetical protein